MIFFFLFLPDILNFVQEITTKKLQRLQTEFDGGEIGDMEQSAEEIAEADSFANISFNFNAAARRGTSHI